MAPPTNAVAAAARRLLASALSSEAHKSLAEILDTMEDCVLTVGFTADAGEERFQVLGPGLFFVTFPSLSLFDGKAQKLSLLIALSCKASLPASAARF